MPQADAARGRAIHGNLFLRAARQKKIAVTIPHASKRRLYAFNKSKLGEGLSAFQFAVTSQARASGWLLRTALIAFPQN